MKSLKKLILKIISHKTNSNKKIWTKFYRIKKLKNNKIKKN